MAWPLAGACRTADRPRTMAQKRGPMTCWTRSWCYHRLPMLLCNRWHETINCRASIEIPN